jgi:uncharacterized membrane protein YphA (DoxX/SURF4 family)
MKTLTWVLSSILALAFLAIGSMKLITPTDELTQSSQGIPVMLLRIAGTAEVLGALGLILPAATRILPILTPIAAIGLVITMVGATIANIVVGTYSVIPLPVVLGVLSAVVAWLRLGRHAVHRRSASTTAAPANAA